MSDDSEAKKEVDYNELEERIVEAVSDYKQKTKRIPKLNRIEDIQTLIGYIKAFNPEADVAAVTQAYIGLSLRARNFFEAEGKTPEQINKIPDMMKDNKEFEYIDRVAAAKFASTLLKSKDPIYPPKVENAEEPVADMQAKSADEELNSAAAEEQLPPAENADYSQPDEAESIAPIEEPMLSPENLVALVSDDDRKEPDYDERKERGEAPTPAEPFDAVPEENVPDYTQEEAKPIPPIPVKKPAVLEQRVQEPVKKGGLGVKILIYTAIAVVAAVAGIVAYKTIKEDRQIVKYKTPPAAVQTVDYSNDIKELKNALVEKINQTAEETQQKIDAIAETADALAEDYQGIKSAVDDVKAEQKQYGNDQKGIQEGVNALAEKTDKNYNENKEAAAKATESFDGYTKKHEEQRQTEVRSMLDSIAESAESLKEEKEILESKLEGMKKSEKARIDNIVSELLKEAEKKSGSAQTSSDSKKPKEDKKEQGLFTNFGVSYSASGQPSTVTYTLFDNAGNPFFEKRDFKLSESLFNFEGNIGSTPLHFTFDFNLLNSKAKGEDNFSGESNENTLFAGLGGRYSLSEQSRNILKWRACGVYRTIDSITEGIPGDFTNEKEGDQSGYFVSLGMMRMDNRTSWNVSYETAKGETNSITTHPVFSQYNVDYDTERKTLSAEIETAMLTFSTGDKTEGAFGVGVKCSGTTSEEGDNHSRSKSVRAYTFVDLFDSCTEKTTRFRIEGGIVVDKYELPGNVEDKRDPGVYLGGRIDF
jgi:hypothetical protein